VNPAPLELQRRWSLVAVAGAAAAAVSIPLAAAAGPPYLALDRINAWVVVFAIGLFAALFATPFLLRLRLGGELETDARWERALLWWGALALVALAIGLLSGAAGDFASDSLAGSLGIVIAAEAAMVLGTLAVWLLSS
jgi:hypothetical protein